MACLAANAPPSLNHHEFVDFGSFAAPSTEGKLPPGEARGISVARKGARGDLFWRETAGPCPRSASAALEAIFTAKLSEITANADAFLFLPQTCSFGAERTSSSTASNDNVAPGVEVEGGAPRREAKAWREGAKGKNEVVVENG